LIKLERFLKALNVAITRYVSDDPQPGIVECEFVDAHGRLWRFLEKTAIVTATWIDSSSEYPQPGVIAVEVTARRQEPNGRQIISVDTSRIDGVESIDGMSSFEVLSEGLVEL